MKRPDIAFSPPDITETEINYVSDTLRSGWITTGPKTKLLERRISELLGTPRSVCLNSQTACAEICLRILGIGEGDEVITAAYTYTASASVICHVGARVVMVDCGRDSFEPNYGEIERRITPHTRAIIPVDFAGIPCDYDRIYEIAERKKSLFRPKNELQEQLGRVAVIADSAHAFGASRGGIPAGRLADFTNFSFHAVKNLTTAEGGAMTWRKRDGMDDESIYKQAQLLSLHGQSKDALEKTALGSWEYDIVTPLYKCNMTDVAAALGLAQLERYPEMLKRRRQIIEKYDAALKPLGIETLDHYTDKYESSGHLYVTRVCGASDGERREIIKKMAESGISCNVHYKPLPMHTAYKKLGFDIKDFPNAYAHYENEITLPLHTKLTDEEVDYIIDRYSAIVKGYIK